MNNKKYFVPKMICGYIHSPASLSDIELQISIRRDDPFELCSLSN